MRVIGNLINEKYVEKFKIDLEENIGYSLEFLIYRALKGFEKQNDNKARYRAIFSKCNHTVEFINDLYRVLIKNQRVGENFGDFKYMLL